MYYPVLRKKCKVIDKDNFYFDRGFKELSFFILYPEIMEACAKFYYRQWNRWKILSKIPFIHY